MRGGAVLPAVLAASLSASYALTAGAVVPATRSGRHIAAINADGLKPSACGSLALTAVVRGQGIFAGTAAAELLLGSSGVDSIDGTSGNDCLVGGGGSDVLDGGPGTDVCIGGPGIDTFTSCETEIQ